MSNLLRNMKIDEGSLVDKGANQNAHVVFWKRNDKPLDKSNTEGVHQNMGLVDKVKKSWAELFKGAMNTEQILERNEAQHDWWELCNAFQESVRSILEDGSEDPGKMLLESSMQFVEAAKPIAALMGNNMYKGLVQGFEAIITDVNKAGKVISTANMTRLKTMMEMIQQLMGEAGATEDQQMQEKACDKPKEKPLMKIKGVDTEMDQAMIEAEVKKRLDERLGEIQKVQDELIEKKVNDLLKRNEDLEKALEIEKDHRITVAFITKANTLPNSGTAAGDLANLLKKVSQKAPDEYPALIAILDTYEKKISENNVLLKEIGGNEAPVNDAYAGLETLANDIQKADPKLTKEQAFAKAMDARPDLYREYKKRG